MTRARLVAFLLLVLLSFDLRGACDFEPVHDLRFRETALDLAIDQDRVWAATSWGVSLTDRHTALPLGSLALPGVTATVAAQNGIAWAGSGASVYALAADPLRILGSVEVGATVNDLLVTGGFLYAATGIGVVQLDLFDPTHPAIAVQMPTSAGRALALASIGTTLYAADGDRTVEAYTLQVPSLPQQVGAIESLPQSSSVQAAGLALAVSNGNQTEILAGHAGSMTRQSLLPFGGSAMAPAGGNVWFMAGNDRVIRAVDLLAAVPTTFVSLPVPLTRGNVNRAMAVASDGDRLFAAAGDSGVLAWDLSDFDGAPLLRVSSIPDALSVVAGTARHAVSYGSGGIRRYADSSGQIVEGPLFEEARRWTLFDGEGTRVLAGAGQTLTLFDIGTDAPQTLSSVLLQSPIVSATFDSPTLAWAVLQNGTLWRVDLSAAAGSAAFTSVSGASFVTAVGARLAAADIRDDGSTRIRYWGAVDPAAPPAEATLDGAATGGIALSEGGIVAAGTFRGLQLVDFGSGGGVRTIDGTSGSPIRDLEIVGSRLFLATSTRLEIRALPSGALERSIALPSTPTAIHASPTRLLAALPNAVAIVDLETSASLPVAIGADPANRFYRRLAVSPSSVFALDAASVHRFRLDSNGLPLPPAAIDLPDDPVAIAADGDRLLAAYANGTVELRDAAGRILASRRLEESADQQILGIRAVAGMAWLSIAKGCSAGACERRTLVLDPAAGLAQTASFSGSVTDVAVHGTMAAVVMAQPNEIRTYDVSSPLLPAVRASRPADGDPVTIDFSGATVWTVGDHLRAWTLSTLAPAGVHLDAWSPDPSGRVSYLDQKVRIAGSCLVIVGRTTAPQLFEVSGATPVPAAVPPVSGAAKDLAVAGNAFHLLTETSYEVWMTERPEPVRGRAVRRH